MRYVFGLVLTLLPLNIQAADSLARAPHGIDPMTIEGSIPEKPSGDEPSVEDPWPYANPYHPTSATNFDRFAVPLSPLSDGNDRSRLSQHLSDVTQTLSVYGHFGNPFFPDSINRRNETDHPYPLDSPTNHYGRSGLMERR